MTLSIAFFILEAIIALLAVGYVCWVFATPKAWKPRSRSIDEYLEDMEQNGITVLHRSDKK